MRIRVLVWKCMWAFNLLAFVKFLSQTVQVKLCSPLSGWASQAEYDCLQSSSVSSWLLVSTLTSSLKYTDCVLLSDVCTSLLLLSEKLCCRSSFLFWSTHDWQLQAPVNKHSPDVTVHMLTYYSQESHFFSFRLITETNVSNRDNSIQNLN